jgi:hypothetical protein
MSRNIHIIRATMQLIIRTCAVVTINENSLVINHNVDNHSNNIIFADTCTILFIGISDYHDWSYEFESRSWRGVLYTTWCDTFCQWLATGLWFSSDTPVSSTNKTDRHDITEILLKMVSNTIALNLYISFHDCFGFYPTLALNNYIQDIFTLLTV